VFESTKDLRFVILNPADLWRRETSKGIIAGDLDQAFAAHPRANLVALGAASLIVPQDGRSQHSTLVVQYDESMHLTRQPNGYNFLTRYVRGI
jgi:hypothetical protein